MIEFLNKKYLNVQVYIWLAFLITSTIFVMFPQIDLYVTSFFYNENTFLLKDSMFERFFYKSVPIMISITSIGSIAIFIYNQITKKNILNINKRAILFIILFLSIAPGLIVNSILKEHWGRARPAQTIQFGGNMQFTPAFVISPENGNSFSCGHGAAAFSMLGFALLAKRRRKLWITLALTYGVLVSIARIIAGGHFLSDTVTSFFIVYISTYILYKLIMKDES
jgi:lipid A 4'-phosphatase